MTEVLLSVNFEPLSGLNAVAVLELWQTHYKRSLPTVEEQPPYFAMVERFGRTARLPEVKFELAGGLPSPRYWFVDSSGTRLVQLQQDWLARNWRKRDASPDYPRYPSLRAPFTTDLETVSRFVVERGLGEIKPVQCEITYINHLRPGEGWTDHGDLSRLLRVWRDPESEGVVSHPEQVGFAASYLFPSNDETPLGRLHVSLQPGYTRDAEEPLYVLTLTARGQPLSGDLDGALGFLDIGHETIVTTFDLITTDEMHSIWRRDASTS